jgi:hypothetical protein
MKAAKTPAQKAPFEASIDGDYYRTVATIAEAKAWAESHPHRARMCNVYESRSGKLVDAFVPTDKPGVWVRSLV